MKKRILIISTSAGTGHVAAAAALEKAFHSDNRVAEVRHEDALNFTNKLFRDFYSKLYETMISGESIRDVVLPTEIDSFWVVPSNKNLAGIEIEFADAPRHAGLAWVVLQK